METSSFEVKIVKRQTIVFQLRILSSPRLGYFLPTRTRKQIMQKRMADPK